eukprot:GHVT01104609.1.p2 GENE.GHVT01104609.1~~GHVT01104609.1.p2  ORF type:complete len:105 (+),score=19.98 GHVT01104609.1:1005-1319(+)
MLRSADFSYELFQSAIAAALRLLLPQSLLIQLLLSLLLIPCLLAAARYPQTTRCLSSISSFVEAPASSTPNVLLRSILVAAPPNADVFSLMAIPTFINWPPSPQ